MRSRHTVAVGTIAKAAAVQKLLIGNLVAARDVFHDFYFNSRNLVEQSVLVSTVVTSVVCITTAAHFPVTFKAVMLVL